MLGIESQQAIALRLMKLTRGGVPARKEASLMTTEKIAAATRTSERLLMGASPASVIKTYRRKVRANVRRLSK
jgi:ABC-type uncharacterized transport system ATPase component